VEGIYTGFINTVTHGNVLTSCLLSTSSVTAAMAKLFESLGKLGLAIAIGGGIVNSALFNGEFCSFGHLSTQLCSSLPSCYLTGKLKKSVQSRGV